MASGQNTTLLPAMSIEQNWSARGSFQATPCSLSQWHWTVSLIHSALILSHFSPLGPISAKASAVRSTCAASPSRRSTSGIAFMASGASSRSRLAWAEADSKRSRCNRYWVLRMPSAAAARSTGLMLMVANVLAEGIEFPPSIGLGKPLPTPAERLVHRNQAGSGLGAAPGQLILGLEQGPFGIQHLQEVAGAIFITYSRQPSRRIARADGLLVVDQPVARPGVGNQ